MSSQASAPTCSCHSERSRGIPFLPKTYTQSQGILLRARRGSPFTCPSKGLGRNETDNLVNLVNKTQTLPLS